MRRFGAPSAQAVAYDRVAHHGSEIAQQHHACGSGLVLQGERQDRETSGDVANPDDRDEWVRTGS